MPGGPGKVIYLEAPSIKLQVLKMPFTTYGNIDPYIGLRLVMDRYSSFLIDAGSIGWFSR